MALAVVSLTCFALGFVFGRSLFVLVVFAAAVAFWWVVAWLYHGGEGDDVTGPLAAVALAFSVAALVGGILVRWFVWGIASLVRRAV